MLARRKLRQRDLKTVRERLTSSTGFERSFEIDLLQVFARQATGASSIVSLALLAIATGTSMLWLPRGVVLGWAVMVGLCILCLYVAARRLARTPAAETDVVMWRRLLTILTALQSLAWSLLVVLFIAEVEPGAKVFLLSVLIFAGAVVTMMASTIPTAVYLGLLPLAAAIGLFIWHGRDIDTLTITAMGAVAQVFFLFLTNRLYSQTLATLEFRAEKDELIAELEAATLNSEEARRKAEDANIAKSRFLATMSHELRTPLNAILGFSEVMKNEVFGPHANPTYRDYAQDIHNSGGHLLNLINEILDLSRIEAGRYELKEEAMNLAHVVDDCRHMLAMRAQKKSQTLRVSVEPDLPKVWADERAIRQAVLNILANAIKFTPQGGDIAIKVGWTASGGQYVAVTDNGPGIPENEIETVLDSFGRGSHAIKTAEEGSGLGLPIVKGLIDLHGGQFVLKSKVRVGTEVIVTLPASRVMDTLPALPTATAKTRAA